MAAENSPSVRLQQLAVADQVTVISRLAESRSPNGRFGPALLDLLFDDLALPRPAKVANTLLALEGRGLVARQRNVRGSWRLTPVGRVRSSDLMSEMDVSAMVAEAAAERAPLLGSVPHPTMPPWLAPPELVGPLRDFLADNPFELNVFGMTRFPDQQDESDPDPVAAALASTRAVCRAHGLAFHLASDRKIVDDLWQNVDAHMWACRYGVGFFEDRRQRGVNYNLTIEVGGMMTIGRRLALLKDVSIDRMPTDLVGKIYTDVDLDLPATVEDAVHVWIRDDLRLGSCTDCPPPHADAER